MNMPRRFLGTSLFFSLGLAACGGVETTPPDQERSTVLDAPHPRRSERAAAEIVTEGDRTGGRDGGTRWVEASYTRDPDGNLLEFIRYPYGKRPLPSQGVAACSSRRFGPGQTAGAEDPPLPINNTPRTRYQALVR